MKTLIFILIIMSFLEETIIPLNLVLLILICRAYIREESENLYLGFGFGLLSSFLTLNSLGINSLIYLFLIQITQVLSRTRLARNPLLIVPISFCLLAAYEVIASLILNVSFQLLPKVLLMSFLSLPIFYIVRLWEERFVVKRDIKLKL